MKLFISHTSDRWGRHNSHVLAYANNKFCIYFNKHRLKNLTEREFVWCLLHELAHLSRSLDIGPYEISHDIGWFQHCSKFYEMYFGKQEARIMLLREIQKYLIPNDDNPLETNPIDVLDLFNNMFPEIIEFHNSIFQFNEDDKHMWEVIVKAYDYIEEVIFKEALTELTISVT
ncbi:MAG: hypothetical protein LBS76_03575 [Mycoplasmataceae bacterium]|nr:hypothetical protein [Mycoplasmataceae bacterium]